MERNDIFNPRLIAGLVAAGILAFGAFILLSAYAGDFRSGRDGRAHALSVSAVGYQGIVRLVDKVGGKSRILRSEAEIEDEDLLVAVIEPQTGKEALQALIEKRGARATLLVLPKWIVMNDPANKAWVRSLGPGAASADVLTVLPGVKLATDKKDESRIIARGEAMLAGISVRQPRFPQTLSGASVTPLLRVPGHGALLARIGDQPLYVLADPDLLNNLGMKDPRTARAALRMLAALNVTDAQSVIFDITLNGFGGHPSLLKLPFQPPFLTLTIALFLAALLAGLHGAFRFGPAAREERAIAFGKLALVDNSAGLIQLARREHRAGAAYADVIRDAAALASAAPPSLRGEALDAYLDRLTRNEDTPFSQLAYQAADAQDRFEMLRAARALFQWKKDNIQ